MSAGEHLNPNQFTQRRAAQLADEGLSLMRQPKPASGSLEAAKARHPAGKKGGPRGVIEGGRSEAELDRATQTIRDEYNRLKGDRDFQGAAKDAGRAMLIDGKTPEERRAQIRRRNRNT